MCINKSLVIATILINVFALNIQISHATSPGAALFEASYFTDEGPFVIVPSTAAAIAILPPALIFGVCVGVTGGIVGLPALPFIESKNYLTSFVVMPGFIASHLVSMPISHAVGLPFYCIKKTLYDFPKWIYKKNFEQL